MIQFRLISILTLVFLLSAPAFSKWEKLVEGSKDDSEYLPVMFFDSNNGFGLRRSRLDIGKLIEEVSASLKLKQYPHGSCAQLEDLANLMPKTLKGLLLEDTIHANYNKLYEVRKIEMLFGQIYHLKESEIPGKLAQLDEAAGKFKALAVHLKVSLKDE